jgi:Xaa-Pro aminopeptidase
MGIQDFGENFVLRKLHHARDIARDMVHELSSYLRPGMTEEEAHEIYKKICQRHHIEKNWHPPKIRFGSNTLRTFYEASVPWTLGENDIYFIDIGPVIDGHEADYGETFTLGSDYEFKRISEASEKLFHLVRDYWLKNKPPGRELYDYAEKITEQHGYQLNLGSDGHRIGDFPHHLIFKGPILDCQEPLVPDAWILEIQIAHPRLKVGAFFEDILT